MSAFLVSVLVESAFLVASGLATLIPVRDLKTFPVHAASSVAVGAYCASFAFNVLSSDVFVALALSLCVGALYGSFTSLLLQRVRPDRMLLAYVAIQLGFEALLRLWVPVTGGAAGLDVSRDLRIFGYHIQVGAFPALALGICLVGAVISWTGQRVLGPASSMVGAGSSHAIGVGIPVTQLWIGSHSLSAALLALAGSAYAMYVGYINPTAFGIDRSVWIIVVALLASRSPLTGALLAAVVIVWFAALLRFLHVPTLVTGQVQELCSGVVLLAVIRLRGRMIFGA